MVLLSYELAELYIAVEVESQSEHQHTSSKCFGRHKAYQKLLCTFVFKAKHIHQHVWWMRCMQYDNIRCLVFPCWADLLSLLLSESVSDGVLDGGAGTFVDHWIPKRDLEEAGNHQDQVCCVSQGDSYAPIILCCRTQGKKKRLN